MAGQSAISRWAKFATVASGGLVLQLSAVALLTRGLGWEAGMATALGLELAILHNFAGHSRWTWADRPAGGGRAVARRLAAYHVACAVTASGTLGIVVMLVQTTGLTAEAANVAGIWAMSVANYLVSDLGLFRAKRIEATREPPWTASRNALS
jgi:putative flippase GtrA